MEPFDRINFNLADVQNLENFRLQGFKLKTDISKKLVYTTQEVFKTLTMEQKKAVAIISTNGGYAIMINISRARFFVLEPLFNKRRRNILAGLNFVKKVDARSTLNIVIHQENIFEFKLKDKTINIRRDNIILLKYKTKTGEVAFHHHTFFLEDNSSQQELKNISNHQTTRLHTIRSNLVKQSFINEINRFLTI